MFTTMITLFTFLFVYLNDNFVYHNVNFVYIFAFFYLQTKAKEVCSQLTTEYEERLAVVSHAPY